MTLSNSSLKTEIRKEFNRLWESLMSEKFSSGGYEYDEWYNFSLSVIDRCVEYGKKQSRSEENIFPKPDADELHPDWGDND